MKDLASAVPQLDQNAAAAVDVDPAHTTPDDNEVKAEATSTAADDGSPEDSEPDDDIRLGEDVAALYSMVQAPAFQLLPLAIAA